MAEWKEKFQIPPSCTLREALKNQLINEIEYQEWASRHYGLPVMRDEFFEQHPSDVKFLDKIKQKNIANSSAIPCFEWNNILYVVCLEPQKINTDQKTVFFITSLKTMESLWKKIESSEKQIPSHAQTLSLSEEQNNTKSQKTHKEKPSDIKKKVDVQKLENDNIEFERISPLRAFMFTIIDLSKGFMNLIAPDQKIPTKRTKSRPVTFSNIDKNKIKKAHKNPVQTIIPKPITSEIAENNQNKTTSPINRKSAVETTAPIDLNKEKPYTGGSSDSAKEETPTPIALDKEEKPFDTDTPPAEQKKPTLATLENTKNSDSGKSYKNSTQKEEIPSSSMDEKTSQEYGAHNTTNSFLILDQKKVTALDQLSPLRRTLEETKHYVNSYILFVFKRGSFIPYKWSSNLQKAEKRVPGAIQKPSIFRIVYVSKQPYFGHLAPVLANNSFFNQWGFETLPKHVVVIPFLDVEKQNVSGAYLGISSTRTLPVKCLHAIEQIVQPLSTYYQDGSLLQKVS